MTLRVTKYCGQTGRLHGQIDACPACGAKNPRQEIRRVLWKSADNFVGGIFEPIDVPTKPTRVWLLLLPDGSPELEIPLVPEQHKNALLEDYVHDWNWENGKLRYYTRFADHSAWILLEWDDEGCSPRSGM